MPLTIEDLDNMSDSTDKKPKKKSGKITADDLDNMSAGGYSAPEPREDSGILPSFETQKEAADFVKNMLVMGGQGAAQGFGDEGIAALKTGSFSSPEYVTERDKIRKSVNDIRTESPISSALAEGIGSTATTMSVPFLKGAPVVKEIISAGIQGAGEAEEMSDIPRSATQSALIQGGMETGGKVLKNVMFDDPTAILTRTIGAGSKHIKGPSEGNVIGAVERLNSKGFFKQGEAKFDVNSRTFKRNAKNLGGIFKAHDDNSLKKLAIEGVESLRDKNKQLLKGKKIDGLDYQIAIAEGIRDLTYDPKGWNAEKRLELAQEIRDILHKDVKRQGGNIVGPIDAGLIENRKRALDAHVKSPAFEKKITDLGVDKQTMLAFRRKLDDLLDMAGGSDYKANNDMMHDLLEVNRVLSDKGNEKYVRKANGSIDWGSIGASIKNGMDPTPVSIARSDIARAAGTPGGQFATRSLKRTPVEYLMKDRSNPDIPSDEAFNSPESDGSYPGQPTPQGFSAPNSIRPAFRGPSPVGRKYNSLGSDELTPMQLLKMRLPRTTEGLLQNKELVIQKLTLAGAPTELVDTVAQALNEDPEAIESIAPMVTMQFPTLFEKSKYNMFDGRVLDPADRAKLADETSKRTDMGSVQRAKIIDELNKTGKYLGE